MKKIISLLLALALAASVLTACGSSAGSSSPSDASGTSGTGSEPAASDGEVTTIVCATNGAPNPFSYVDEDGNPVGYDIELVRAAFDLLPQYDLQINVVSDALADVDSGRAQLSANNWAYKDERAEKYIYSDAHFCNNYVIAVAADNTDITQFSDLQGKVGAHNAGGNYALAIENYNATLSEDETPIELAFSDEDLLSVLQSIETGKYDFELIDQQMFLQYVEEYGLNLKGVELSDEDIALIGTPYSYVIFEKTDFGRQLQEEFNEALAQIIENGTALEISEKYFGGDFVPDAGVKAPSET